MANNDNIIAGMVDIVSLKLALCGISVGSLHRLSGWQLFPPLKKTGKISRMIKTRENMKRMQRNRQS